MNKMLVILAVCVAAAACPALAAPTYFTDRAAFDAAAGGGLSFESFEEDWPSPVPVKFFTDFTVSETGGINLLAQARNYSATWLTLATTDGTGALWYDDNDDSVCTFFDFLIPVTAFGLDITAESATTVTIGGSVSDTLVLPAETPSFWGVIDPEGITSISFDASGGPNIAFDSASYGLSIITVEVDIKPGSCPNPFNGKSQGSVPVAIVGTPDFDVTAVDPESLILVGPDGDVLALDEWEIIDSTQPGDYDPGDCGDCFNADDYLTDTDGDTIPDTYLGDGFPDLVVKFDTQELAEAIGEADRDDCIELTLMGVTFDGVAIIGHDSMVIKTKIK